MNEEQIVLTIDNGNSHPHVGIFKGGCLQNILPLQEFIDDPLPITKNIIAIASNVGKHKFPLLYPQITLKNFIKDNMFFEMPINYEKTLGEDRMIQAFYLFSTQFKKRQKKQILLLDIGTYLTADLIGHDGFHGGYIFLGEQIFLNSYHAYSHQLPKLHKNAHWNTSNGRTPHTTENALINSSFLYFSGIYKELNDHFHPLENIVVTGGDHLKHCDLIRNCFPNSDVQEKRNLIHYSLLYFANRQNLFKSNLER